MQYQFYIAKKMQNVAMTYKIKGAASVKMARTISL